MLEVFYIALSGVMLAVFFMVIIDDGMIFERYGKWIRIGNQKWKNMAGACIYCTTPWAAMLMYILFVFAKPIWTILAIIGCANLIIKLLDKMDVI